MAIEHGFSRLPVIGDGDDDDVVGLAYTKDLMRAERDGERPTPVTDSLRPARFVPENKPVNRLMREMQAEKFHLAIVADEYGGIAGMITLEDCLEELVGEIVDEYDTRTTEVERLRRRRLPRRRRHGHRRPQRAARRRASPTRTGTRSAGSCSARSSTCPSAARASISTVGGSPPPRSRVAAFGGSASAATSPSPTPRREESRTTR